VNQSAPQAPIDIVPVELVVLQGTSFCNLNCTYCDLSEQSRKTRQVMDFELIEHLFRELFVSNHVGSELTIIWHSGEPLTLPPSYYERAIGLIIALRDELCGDARITVNFDIQTNGVLIDQRWCDFFQRHQEHLHVGISCDGPATMHDAFRRGWNGGKSHAKAIKGMAMLTANDIKFKVIAVVTDHTLADPESFFAFFQAYRASLRGFHFNVLAQSNLRTTGLHYTAKDRQRYRLFFQRLLQLSHEAARNNRPFVIENFTQALTRIVSDSSESSYMAQTSAPCKSLNVDSRGNVTTFYAGLSPDIHKNRYGDDQGLCLGNIQDQPLDSLLRSSKLTAIQMDFDISTEACRESCEYFNVCSGGFELTKLERFGRFSVTETPECVIHVKALTDALLEDIAAHQSVYEHG